MKKLFTTALALLLVCAMLPISALAVDYTLGNTSCNFYNLISKTDYNLAPGAVESEIVINDATGNNRNVIHAIEVDLTNPNISVMPTNKNISETVDYTDTDNWGIQTVTEQAAHVENNLGLNVVGAMNVSLSWGFTHPYGLLIYNGKVLCDNRLSCDTCGSGHPGGGYLAITKDGKAELRDATAPLDGTEWMAQTVCFNYLVRNGVNQHTAEDHVDSSRAPRSVIGIKENGNLVIMMNDGRQSPYSAGFTNHEMAETMIALGCVDAINCDGGGSSTFLSEREGTNALTMKSSPSDGSERSTLSGILVISKAVRDGNFDHASIETETSYVTPNSTVTFTATGADSAGGPAEIPADMTWQLADPSFGTVENGVFTSNGKTGAAVVQAVYNGNVVGECTVNVVIPESISFVMDNITAPFGKSITLDVTAKYGYYDVALKEGDITFTLSDNALGTVTGSNFKAPIASEVTSGTVTATLVHNTSITDTAGLTLGRGSQIVYDFEEGPESIANWNLTYKSPYTPDKYYFADEISVVSKEEGKVKSGNYAFKYKSTANSITCMNWCQSRLGGLGIDLTDAVSLSFWMYIPEGSHGYEWDFGSAIPIVLGHEFKYGTGWQYFTVPVNEIGANVTALDQVRLYRSDTNNTPDGYVHNEHPNYYADVTYYIDDITVNYSSAVEDFDPPIISNLAVGHSMTDTPIALSGQTIDQNVVSFVASAKDNTEKSNYTGLDTTSAKMYVDGIEVDTTCSDAGYIATNNMTLANGTHIVRVEVSDHNNNTQYMEKTLVIAGADSQSTIRYEKADESLADVGIDSLVWMNLTAEAVEDVDVVHTTLDLDNNSIWELDHAVLADGFEMEYTVDEESNDATITISRVRPISATGETVLASIPVRVWSPEFINSVGSEDYTSYRLVSVMTYAEMGELTTTDGSVTTFASDMLTTSTEYNSTRLTSTFDKKGWHVHNETALEDKAATCTEDGYTGRTFCNDCNSIVVWGTTLEATGHDYSVVGGQNVCKNCGETGSTANGWVQDEKGWKYYLEGNAVYGWVNLEDGWHYFYNNGYAATGTVTMNGIDYQFADDKGLSIGGWKYTANGNMYYYCHRYYKQTWAEIDGEKYYFNYQGVCATGISTIDTEAYEFTEDGKLIRAIDGVFNYDGYYYYAIDGEIQYDSGLVEWEDNYYYVRQNGRLVTWDYFVSEVKANGLLPSGDYKFGEDAKMILKNGVDYDNYGNLCYFIKGVQQYDTGIVEWNGDFYFVRTNGQLSTYGRTIDEDKTNGLIPAGTYEFGADAKMVMPKGTWFYDSDKKAMVSSLTDVNSLHAKVTFEATETGTACVLAAHYDNETSALTKMEFISTVSTTQGENTTYTTPVMNVSASETVKIYVWNNTNGIAPVLTTPAAIAK